MARCTISTARAMSNARTGLPRRPVWVLAVTPIVLWMLLFYVSPTRSPGFLIVVFAVVALIVIVAGVYVMRPEKKT